MSAKSVSPRKQAERALQDSEMRLSLALYASGDGLWDWDVSSGVTWLSPSYYAMTGYCPGEVKSDLTFFQRLVHPEDWSGIYETMQAHLRGESEISEIEYRIIRADGSQRWMFGRGRVVARGAAGEPLRMIGHVTDITERKRLEQSLRESETRFRSVLEDQTEVIGRIQPDGTFLFVNAVYCRFFGKSAEELLGRRWQPVAHPDDVPMIEARLAQLSPAQPVVVIENRVYAGDGSLHWMQFVNRGFFDAAGRLLEIQSVGRDITERVTLEQERGALLEANRRLSHELLRLQEKERAALAKELHDELSQEIVAIRAHAGAIQRRAGGDAGRSLRDAEAITEAASRIYDISHRLMDGLRPRMLDSAGLGDPLRSLLALWSKRYPEVRVIARWPGGEAECPEAMRIQLYRIVQEALTNVARHAQARRVRVCVSVRAGRTGRVLRLVLRDDGRGMEVSAATSGYGLLVMRERARVAGGELRVSSRPGGGVRIAVDAPL